MSESATPVAVLALLPSPDEQAGLRHIFRHSRWVLHLAGTLTDGRAILDEDSAGVVIAARRLPDASWKDVLQVVQGRSVPLPLIVAARVADERLWAEVLNLGAYDLLSTPFEPLEVRRSVSLAWRHWRDTQRKTMASGG
jgi:DNA-binding NtrC family response regulator